VVRKDIMPMNWKHVNERTQASKVTAVTTHKTIKRKRRKRIEII